MQQMYVRVVKNPMNGDAPMTMVYYHRLQHGTVFVPGDRMIITHTTFCLLAGPPDQNASQVDAFTIL